MPLGRATVPTSDAGKVLMLEGVDEDGEAESE